MSRSVAFPAYFITILATFLYAHQADLGPVALQDMFLKNTDGFWEEALLIRRHNAFFPPGWTMNMEFAASLLLPFTIVLFKTNKKLIGWLIFFCLLTGNSVLNIMFLHFLLGLAIAGYYTQIRDQSFKQRKVYRYRYWIIAGAVLLFSLRQIHRMSPLGSTLIYVIEYLNYDFFFFSGIAAAIFLTWLISSDRLQRLMSGKLLLFFGKISYGIYLMHWLVGQWIFFDHWDEISHLIPNEALRITACLTVAVTATIVLATLLYYLVERPTINWGKRISRRWNAVSA